MSVDQETEKLEDSLKVLLELNAKHADRVERIIKAKSSKNSNADRTPVKNRPQASYKNTPTKANGNPFVGGQVVMEQIKPKVIGKSPIRKPVAMTTENKPLQKSNYM